MSFKKRYQTDECLRQLVPLDKEDEVRLCDLTKLVYHELDFDYGESDVLVACLRIVDSLPEDDAILR